ncbi:MAG: glycosyltransferase family 39 protein, partial [Chloroflexota bacterium]
VRAPWALIGILTIPVVFWTMTRLKGVFFGLCTAALLAIYHFHIHYSRVGLNNIADPLLVSLAVFLFYRAKARRDSLDWALLGVVCGISLYGYQGARLTLIVIGALALYYLAHNRARFWQDHRRGLAIALGAFLIVGAPIMQFAFFFADEYNARINQMGIIQSGWLVEQARRFNTSIWYVLFDQFRRAALAFNFYPDQTVWYGLPQPLLDPIFGTLFLLGLGYGTVSALKPHADRRMFPIVAWWWGAMILGGVLTENAPSSMRMVTLTVPVCFFITLAIFKILNLAKHAIADFPTVKLLIGALILFGVINVKIYWFDYTPLRIYGSTRAEAATMMAPALNELKSNHDFYFVGAPFMYWGFATLPFLVPDAQAIDILDPITPSLLTEVNRSDRGSVFIVMPERSYELVLLKQGLPRGETREFHTPTDGHVIATLYIVSP